MLLNKNYNLYSFFLLILILLLLLSLSQSCKHTTEPLSEAELTITLEDVSCTEAWIMLKPTNLPLPATVTIYKNNSVAQNNILCYGDTVLYIDSLLPNQTYRFQATSQSANQSIKSNEITAATLDTTSHNFTFQSWTFGTIGSSSLYDVAIIDENNIWAVGEINVADTSINGYTTYNAVHWNGTDWELKRITVNFRGSLIAPPLEGVYAFSSTDIWFVGSLPIHGDGTNWTIYDLRTTVDPNLSLSKAWGTSSNDMYFVGRNGSIAHWNGRKWTKIESWTTVDLLDVWGGADETVWFCGYTSDYVSTVLLRYDGQQWCNKLYEGSPNNQNNNEYIGPISSVWSNSKYFTYITNWAFIYTQANKNTLDIKRITPWFSDVAFSMRGTNHNNIFITGQHGLLGHFNGATYQEIEELKNQSEYLNKVDVKNNTVAAVGLYYQGITGSKAVVHIIKHNK